MYIETLYYIIRQFFRYLHKSKLYFCFKYLLFFYSGTYNFKETFLNIFNNIEPVDNYHYIEDFSCVANLYFTFICASVRNAESYRGNEIFLGNIKDRPLNLSVKITRIMCVSCVYIVFFPSVCRSYFKTQKYLFLKRFRDFFLIY